MTDVLETGIDILDRRLGGGLPPGSVVLVSASPASQSELLLYTLAATRPTRYLTTLRSESAVQSALDRFEPSADATSMRAVDCERPLEDADSHIRDLPERSNLIIDPIEALEREGLPEFPAFMNDLRATIRALGSVAYLHGLDGTAVPPGRDVTEYMVDVVFQLYTEVRGDSIENRLTVPKFRGGRFLEDVMKLDLTTEVGVDVSRNIV